MYVRSSSVSSVPRHALERLRVQAGDAVREGQTVAAIEALNVLNEVEVASAGRVKEVLVDDGQAVEYGQVLMVVEP